MHAEENRLEEQKIDLKLMTRLLVPAPPSWRDGDGGIPQDRQ